MMGINHYFSTKYSRKLLIWDSFFLLGAILFAILAINNKSQIVQNAVGVSDSGLVETLDSNDSLITEFVSGDVAGESETDDKSNNNDTSTDLSVTQNSEQTKEAESVSNPQHVSLKIDSSLDEGAAKAEVTVNGESLPIIPNGRTQRIELEDGSQVKMRVKNNSSQDSSNSVEISIKSESE